MKQNRLNELKAKLLGIQCQVPTVKCPGGPHPGVLPTLCPNGSPHLPGYKCTCCPISRKRCQNLRRDIIAYEARQSKLNKIIEKGISTYV